MLKGDKARSGMEWGSLCLLGMAWPGSPLCMVQRAPKPPDPEAAVGWMLCVLSLALLPPVFGESRRERVWGNVSLWDPSLQIL